MPSANDVYITPASKKIEYYDSSSVVGKTYYSSPYMRIRGDAASGLAFEGNSGLHYFIRGSANNRLFVYNYADGSGYATYAANYLQLRDSSSNIEASLVAGNGSFVSGNFAIGTNSASEKLHVVGNGLFTGNNTVFGASDANQNTYLKVLGSGAGYTAAGIKLLTYNGNDRPGGVYSYANAGTQAWYSGPVYGASFKWGVNYKSSIANTGSGLELVADDAYNLFMIDKTGKVGIGETSPTEALHVYSPDTGNQLGLYSDANEVSALNFYENTTKSAELLFDPSANDLKLINRISGGDIIFRVENNQEVMRLTDARNLDLPSNNAILFDNTNDNNQSFIRNGGTNAVNMQFGLGTPDNANVKMILDGDGKVGIGTTSPGQKLHVQGSIAVSGAESAGDSGYGHSIYQYNQSGAQTLRLYSDSRGVSGGKRQFIYATARLSISSTENMGIGPSTSGEYLHLFSGDTAHMYLDAGGSFLFRDTDASSAIRARLYTDTGRFILNDSTPATQIELNPEGVSYIAGNFGVGLGNPQSFSDRFSVQIGTNSGWPIGFTNAAEDVKGAIRTDQGDNYIAFASKSESDIRLFYNDNEANTALIVKGSGTSAGRVGIGTTAPAAGLHISSTVSPQLRITSGSNTQCDFKVSQYGGLDLDVNHSLVLDVTRHIDYKVGSGRLHRFYENNVEKMRLDDGKLGIGTTSPAYALDVSGAVDVRLGSGLGTDVMIAGTNHGITRQSNSIKLYNNAKNGFFGVRDSATGKVQISGANVYVGGMDTSDSLLELREYSTGRGQICFYPPGGTSKNRIYATTEASPNMVMHADASIELDADENIDFDAGGSTRMYITSAGKVGIGTTSPQQTLHVEGTFRVRDGNSSSQRLEGYGQNDNFVLAVSGTDALALSGGTPGVRFIDGSANPHLTITESGTNAAQFSAASAVPVCVMKEDVGIIMDADQGIRNHVQSLANFMIDAGTGINTVDLQGSSKIQNILLDAQFPTGFPSATPLDVKLPVAIAGMEFIVTLGVTTNNLGNLTLRLIANGSDIIYNGANAVSNITYTKNIGESIHVICFEANKWSVVAHV